MICIGLFCYFSLHYSGGDHGLEARDTVRVKVSTLQSELNQLKQQKLFYEKRIDLINNSKADSDLLDELARSTLEYAKQSELVLFE